MARALQLARLGLATTHPNPRVGCVLVQAGAIVGEGFHRRAGGAHAEVEALRDAGERARGATAFVTLEPCCHHGRTPPCTSALLAAGVSRVVAAMRDPNPAVAGRGLAELEAAGVQVMHGVMQDEAEELNRGFVTRMREGRPCIRVKLGMSLDGRTAMASGESQWITGRHARRDVQKLRAGSAAVLTGIGTVLADDPALTVRAGELAGWWALADEPPRQPLRVVVDSSLRMPPTARLLSQPGPVLIATCSDEQATHAHLRALGAEVTVLPAAADGRVDLAALAADLARREINEVLVEAGGTLAGALIVAGLVHELVLYVAPGLLGDEARGFLHLPGLRQLAERVQLHIEDVRMVGQDIRLLARVLARTSV